MNYTYDNTNTDTLSSIAQGSVNIHNNLVSTLEWDDAIDSNRGYWSNRANNYIDTHPLTETVNPRDNRTDKTTISMTDYDDNHGYDVTVVGTASDDNFTNNGTCSKIFGGAGDDSIDNWENFVSISGGTGDDTITFGQGLYSNSTTVYGGKGNDSIKLYNDDNVIQYANGDGNDTITGWNEADTLYIEGSYTRDTVSSSVVFHVGNGSITFTDIVSNPWDDYYIVKNINTVTVPSGTFSSAKDPVAPSVTTTSGSSSSTSTTTDNSVTATDSSTTSSSGGSSSSTVSSSSNIYIGGDKVISNYTGQPVNMTAKYKGANFSGNNFVVNSLTGTLTIENVADKIIDLRDGAGNEFVKAYKASAAGVVDGRGINAYEIIEGSAAGMDVIFAGDGGSQLWGGSGSASDAIAGGNGSDIFIGGRYQGADVFYSASSADFVNLTDATLSDIVAAVEVNGNIAIGFNTGNIITIQSTELLSAAVNLADGSSWRFNHVTKGWQSA